MCNAAASTSFSLRSFFCPSRANPFTRNERFITTYDAREVGLTYHDSEWGCLGVTLRIPKPAHFRDVAANIGFVARRRCQTPWTGLGLAGTLTPYRGSGSSEPFGPYLGAAESSHVSCASSSVPSRFSTEHMVPEDHPNPGRSCGSKGTVAKRLTLRQCDQWAN
ncbi:hypothetical protein PUN28_019094 [Cardiocondyla obscurior]|uniref:Uncharacterized protein n=1 Tax=Cardiocondyla obscurior TaxID=286306 RepID=A0AAW2EE76_9HYME